MAGSKPITVNVSGLAELAAKLGELPRKIEQRVARKMLRGAAGEIRQRIRQNARGLDLSKSARRTLAKSVFVTVSTRGGAVRSFVKIKKPPRNTEKKEDAFFWRWIEYGTVERARGNAKVARHKPKPGGKQHPPGYTGKIHPQPFVRPAIQSGIGAAVERAHKIAEEELVKIVKEMGL